MEEWKEYKLGDVAKLTTGFPFDGHKYSKEGIRVVRGDNVTIGSLRWDSDKDKRWSENFDRASEFALSDGDIVIGMDGSRVGKNRAQVKQYDLPLLIAQRVACVRHNELSTQQFLYYHIFSDRFEQYIKAVQTGTSIPHVSLKQIGDFPVIVPSIKTQQRIASILSSLDDKIEVNRKINDNLEQQAQALFKSWFVDFEPFKDQPFVESELGMIPQGWRVGTLGEIIKEIESGSRPKGGAETDGIPSIGAEKIERFGVYDYSGEKFINNDFYTNMKRGHVEDGDVLLYKDGAYTGKSSMALDGFPYCECAVNEHVFLLRTESSKSQFFLYYLISYPEIKTMIHTLASSKAAQPGLNQKELLGLDIIIPDEDTVKLFNNLVSPSMHQIATNSKQSRRLAELRDTLLPRLMSGELKVNDIEL